MKIGRITDMVLAVILTATTAFAASERLALVSSEKDNSVTVLDLLTEKEVKVLPTGKVPHAMASSPSGKIFVNNRGSKELTVIDANTMTVAATIPLPATSFQLALAPDGKTLAVVYQDALKLSLVDVATNAVLRTVEIGEMPANFKGATMKHPSWSPDGNYVYCPESVGRTIVKVEAATGKIVKNIALKVGNHYLHASPDGKLLYAVNEASKEGATSLTLIDSATDAVVAELPLSLDSGEKGGGHHGAFSPDGHYFFFANLESSGLHVLDVASRKWVKVIKTGKGPGHPAISPDGKYFFIVHHKDGVISVVDIARQEFVKDIKIGDGSKQAHAAYFTPDGKYFYAAASEDNVMAKIDVAKMELISTMPVGKASMFFAIKEGNSYPSTE